MEPRDYVSLLVYYNSQKYLQSFLKAFKFMDAWYVFFLQDCKNVNFIAEVRFFFLARESTGY